MTPQSLHQAQQLITLFNPFFIPHRQTELVCCEAEPIYRPACGNHPNHRIIFAHGFFASALHEIAHWCVAGQERRLLEDFGYWYVPDGRTAQQQTEFEKVEIKPQALEWIFSVSAGFRFHFSADNLNGAAGVSEQFQQKVLEQVQQYIKNGLPSDAADWSNILLNHYRPNHTLSLTEFYL